MMLQSLVNFLQLRQYLSKTLDEIGGVADRSREPNLVDAPTRLIRSANLPYLTVANVPNKACSRTIGRDNEGIARVTAVRVLILGDRTETPAVGGSFGNKRKAEVNRCTLWPS